MLYRKSNECEGNIGFLSEKQNTSCLKESSWLAVCVSKEFEKCFGDWW